ncbi:MAG TPA: 30S ribosomal protein S17 [Deltaproteobacteria bacterium]|nr:30S ribosomal protein S17 [Deltaproteobacteria bacterium]HCP47704.1 30S ribosomal protein S17 [Deltaproteobacteria bacterium]|tara:strand:+ start:953 stop:1231 length:279 start_codon:yes stop_codon:yes gene_type:complete
MTVETQTTKRRNRRALQGLVVSDKMDKTIVVRVTRQVKHPRYKKYVRVSKKYMAHDEESLCGVGDLVTIVEGRPLSRHKRWRLRSIDRKAVG